MTIIALTAADHVVRARHAAQRPTNPLDTIRYFLDLEKGTRNGGRNPEAMTCATTWTDAKGHVWHTSDCIGFLAWDNGFSRKQPKEVFSTYDGAINCDSLIIDARGDGWQDRKNRKPPRRQMFQEITRPYPGCMIVMPSIYPTGGGRIPGHCGEVVEVPAEWDPKTPQLELVRVIHCSPSNVKRCGQAIGETSGVIWSSRQWGFFELVTK
jgi:hypothetical protein